MILLVADLPRLAETLGADPQVVEELLEVQAPAPVLGVTQAQDQAKVVMEAPLTALGNGLVPAVHPITGDFQRSCVNADGRCLVLTPIGT